MIELSNWYGLGVPAAFITIAWIVALGVSPPGCLFGVVLVAVGYWFMTTPGRHLLLKLQKALS